MSARPRVVAVVGPTASGKSALGISLARRLDGEIVNCDSTAVYCGFDIGTDKVAAGARQGVPHHLVDVVAPTEVYSAARFASDASAVVREILARGRTPILVGGTGLYYRVLTRGLFPGPGADEVMRARLERIAARQGEGRLHAMLARVDPISAARISPGDRKRVVRALEVYRLTGRTLTEHFEATVSPLGDCEIVTLALRMPAGLLLERLTRRVDEQFARGIVAEVNGLLKRGVPETARPFGGLVYRQVMELRRGVRDEPATRGLIVQENRRYARRQMAWFRKEPGLHWLDGPGEQPEVTVRAAMLLA